MLWKLFSTFYNLIFVEQTIFPIYFLTITPQIESLTLGLSIVDSLSLIRFEMDFTYNKNCCSSRETKRCNNERKCWMHRTLDTGWRNEAIKFNRGSSQRNKSKCGHNIIHFRIPPRLGSGFRNILIPYLTYLPYLDLPYFTPFLHTNPNVTRRIFSTN